MAELLISPAANDDLTAIREYITKELDNPKAASDTVNKIIKSIKNLACFPMSGASLEGVIEFPNDYRFIVSGKYISFYHHIDDTVFVDRILYGGRDFMKILFGILPGQSTEEI